MDLSRNIPEYIKKSKLWNQFDHENFSFEEIPEEFMDFSILSENKIKSLKNKQVSSEYVNDVAKIFKLLNYWIVNEPDYQILSIVMKIPTHEEYDDILYQFPLYEEIKELVHKTDEELDRLSLKYESPYISGFRFYRMLQNKNYDLNSYERIKIKYLVVKYESTNDWSHLRVDNLEMERNESIRYFNLITSKNRLKVKYLSYCDTTISKNYKNKATKIYFEDDGDYQEIKEILGERNYTDQLVFLCDDWEDMSILEYFDYSSDFFEDIGLKDLIDEFRTINPNIIWDYLYESDTIIIYKKSLENDYSSMLHSFYSDG